MCQAHVVPLLGALLVGQQSTGKTAFDVDIDGMEEQPWRHPGVDIADFFNYGFTEDSWRVYCEKQLRYATAVREERASFSRPRSPTTRRLCRHAHSAAEPEILALNFLFLCVPLIGFRFSLKKVGSGVVLEWLGGGTYSCFACLSG